MWSPAAGDLLPDLGRAAQAFVVVDAAVADPWLARVTGSLESRGVHVVPLTVPSGEAAKTMQVYGTLLHQLASQEAHRDDVVVALGGGTVGDLAGFVASTYMRGLGVVQVPTTLIGQVDAAIGGKTAVNLPEGKNLVGTFHQPLAVLCDVEALATLPDRDYRSGLAEVAKYGLALDPRAARGPRARSGSGARARPGGRWRRSWRGASGSRPRPSPRTSATPRGGSP